MTPTAVDGVARERAEVRSRRSPGALYERGWMPGTAGNVSVRLPGGAALITAGGRDQREA